MKKVIDLYKSLGENETLLPTNTGFDFWEDTYEAQPAIFDREFARRYTTFEIFDFMGAETMEESKANFKADVLSILTFNEKRYAEMYRVFLVENEDDPITYNYDMTETTGAQENTTGAQTDTHNVAPYNTSTLIAESSDVSGSRTDNFGQRIDTDGARTDTYDSNAWTLTRKGNIGVQTAADILRLHTQYWTETYKFFNLIFDDIAKQLLMVGD